MGASEEEADSSERNDCSSRSASSSRVSGSVEFGGWEGGLGVDCGGAGMDGFCVGGVADSLGVEDHGQTILRCINGALDD